MFGGGVLTQKTIIMLISSKNLRHFICHISFHLLFGFIFINVAHPQVGIGTSTPHASAILDISSSSKGLLIPRMTMLQRISIPSPSKGLMVYQTDGSKGVWHYNGIEWEELFIRPTIRKNTYSLTSSGYKRSLVDSITLYNGQYVELLYNSSINSGCFYHAIVIAIEDLSGDEYYDTGNLEAYTNSACGVVSTSGSFFIKNKSGSIKKYYIYIDTNAFLTNGYTANWSTIFKYY